MNIAVILCTIVHVSIYFPDNQALLNRCGSSSVWFAGFLPPPCDSLVLFNCGLLFPQFSLCNAASASLAYVISVFCLTIGAGSFRSVIVHTRSNFSTV